MSYCALLVVFALSAAVQTSHSQTTDVVDCPDQQKYCSCSRTADVCEFTLRFEQRQTFTSYALKENGELTFDGTIYFLDHEGYHPAAPTGGSCRFEGVTLDNDEDFTSRNCSVPMTVDGVSYSSIITVNGGTPGPTLIVTADQLLVVHVLNYLTCDAISVHWHGLFQRDTPWMDGVGFVTQPPIDPGATFDYIFRASPKGTFWYHSHIGPQRTDGLYGGLVIRDKGNSFQTEVHPRILPDNPTASLIDSPEQYTLTVIDWQRELSRALFTRSNSSIGFFLNKSALTVPTDQDEYYNGTCTHDGAGTGVVPYWSGLINGRGRKSDTTRAPLSVFSVASGNYYRFRVIGVESQFAHKLSIDGHTLTVIATDGQYTEPASVEFIVVHAGERYDFLVDTNNMHNELNYWIRAESLEVNLTEGVEHSARAILTYRDAGNLDWRNGYSSVPDARHQCSPNSSCRVLNCPFKTFGENSSMRCVSLVSLQALFPPSDERQLPLLPPPSNCTDCMHFLNFAFEGPGTGASSINARSFQLPTTAFQTNCNQYSAELSDNSTNLCDRCTEASCRCTNVLPIASGIDWNASAPEFPSIVMVFSGLNSTFAHPIHMHGHAYHVVYIGYGKYNEDGLLLGPTQDIACDNPCSNPQWANGSPPDGLMERVNTSNRRIVSSAIRKDTLIIPAGGYVVIAFQANNPGYWFLHCHVEEHQLQGMALMIQEYTANNHRAPPDGINEDGSFLWTITDYNLTKQEARTCANVRQTTSLIAGVSIDDQKITLSEAEFSIMIVIIILLVLYGIIISLILVLYCCKKSKAGMGKQRRVIPQDIPLQ